MKQGLESPYEAPLLLTPGPVNVPREVLTAGALWPLHHRTEEFTRVLTELLQGMKELFGTEEDVLLTHTTGRGAMEGVLCNLFSPGETILSLCNGKFGEMFAQIAQCRGLRVIREARDWDQPLSLEKIETVLKENPSIQGITVVHSDTSTGICNPVQALGELARRYNVLLLADGISSTGILPFEFDNWNVSAAVTASQKGLMSPPGISFTVLDKKAWERVENRESSSYFINLKNIREIYKKKKETPGTTPVSLVCSAHQAVKMMRSRGLEKVYSRHAIFSRAVKKSMEALGCKIFLKETGADLSTALTVARLPEGISSQEVVSYLRENMDILISRGLGDYSGNCIRVGHMGCFHLRDLTAALSAMEFLFYKRGLLKTSGSCLPVLMENLGG